MLTATVGRPRELPGLLEELRVALVSVEESPPARQLKALWELTLLAMEALAAARREAAT